MPPYSIRLDPRIAPAISNAAGELYCIAEDIDSCLGSVGFNGMDVPASLAEADAIIQASIASIRLRKGSIRLTQLADLAHCGESPIASKEWRSLQSARRIAEMLHKALPADTTQALAIADAATNYSRLLPAASVAYRYHRNRDLAPTHHPSSIDLAVRKSPFPRFAREVSRTIEVLRGSGPNHGFVADQLMIHCDQLADGPARILAELPLICQET